MKCNYCGELVTIDDNGQCSNCGLPRYNPDEARECMEKLNQKDTPHTDASTIDCGWDTTQPVVPKTFAQMLEIELYGKRIALAAMGSIAESTQLRVSELEDALDLNRDEFARILAIASGGEFLSEEALEVKGICERARDRTWQLVPMIEQLESANARIQTLSDSLSALIYTAERTAELITSASDRYDIDVAIESAKEALK